MIKLLCLILFSILSIVCLIIEVYEIGFDTNVSFSDHLHNLIDHIAYVYINYIGYKVGKNGK